MKNPVGKVMVEAFAGMVLWRAMGESGREKVVGCLNSKVIQDAPPLGWEDAFGLLCRAAAQRF